MHYILFILFWIQVPNVLSCISQTLVLDPGTIEALDGDEITLTCRLIADSPLTSKDLAFQLQSTTKSPEEISSDHVTIINASAAQLRYRPILDDFAKQSIACYVRNNRTERICSSIHVYKPINLKITKYEVDNWDVLWFEWESNESSSCSAWYKASVGSNFTRCRNETPGSPGRCNVSSPFEIAGADTVMVINVSCSYRAQLLREPVVKSLSIQLHHIVRPKKVCCIMHHLVLGTPGSIFLAFVAPKEDKILTYSIVVECDIGSYRHVDEKTLDRHKLISVEKLPAFSNCTVSVKCRSSACASSQQFLWSDSEIYQFQTEEDVPLAAPEVLLSGYEVYKRTGNLMDLRVYFQPLPTSLARGRVKKYRLQLITNKSHTTMEINQTQSFLLRNLSTLQEYIVLIDAFTTSYNLSLMLKPIKISEQVHYRTKHYAERLTVMIFNDSFTRVLLPHKANNNELHTVVWCEATTIDSTQTCQGSIEWSVQELSSSVVSSYDIISPRGFTNSHYMFGLATRDNGIQWTDKQCIYHREHAPENPDMSFIAGHSSVTISYDLINKETCRPNPFIIRYHFSYCPWSQDHQCLAAPKKMNVSSESMPVIIAGLSPETEYDIKLWSSSMSSQAPAKSYQFHTTKDPISPGIIAVIVVCAILAGGFISFGIYAISRCVHRVWKKMNEGIDVSVAPVHQTSLERMQRMEQEGIPMSEVEDPDVFASLLTNLSRDSNPPVKDSNQLRDPLLPSSKKILPPVNGPELTTEPSVVSDIGVDLPGPKSPPIFIDTDLIPCPTKILPIASDHVSVTSKILPPASLAHSSQSQSQQLLSSSVSALVPQIHTSNILPSANPHPHDHSFNIYLPPASDSKHTASVTNILPSSSDNIPVASSGAAFSMGSDSDSSEPSSPSILIPSFIRPESRTCHVAAYPHSTPTPDDNMYSVSDACGDRNEVASLSTDPSSVEQMLASGMADGYSPATKIHEAKEARLSPSSNDEGTDSKAIENDGQETKDDDDTYCKSSVGSTDRNNIMYQQRCLN